MNYIKIILITLVICINGLSGDQYERSIDLSILIFQFYPCEVKQPIITLNNPKIKKFTDDLIVLEINKIKYKWVNKSILYKNSKNLGCYQFLCVKWNWGFEFFYPK